MERLRSATRLVLGLAVCAILFVAGIRLQAGTLTGTQPTTTGQDTYIQNTLVANANTAKCAKFGLGPSCTTANLATAGCVAVAFNTLTKRNANTFQVCTIYTLDATGANALASEQMAQKIVDSLTHDLALDVAATNAAFDAATSTLQDNICSQLGRPAGCNFHQ
jgi:hypothetical protein